MEKLCVCFLAACKAQILEVCILQYVLYENRKKDEQNCAGVCLCVLGFSCLYQSLLDLDFSFGKTFLNF